MTRPRREDGVQRGKSLTPEQDRRRRLATRSGAIAIITVVLGVALGWQAILGFSNPHFNTGTFLSIGVSGGGPVGVAIEYDANTKTISYIMVFPLNSSSAGKRWALSLVDTAQVGNAEFSQGIVSIPVSGAACASIGSSCQLFEGPYPPASSAQGQAGYYCDTAFRNLGPTAAMVIAGSSTAEVTQNWSLHTFTYPLISDLPPPAPSLQTISPIPKGYIVPSKIYDCEEVDPFFGYNLESFEPDPDYKSTLGYAWFNQDQNNNPTYAARWAGSPIVTNLGIVIAAGCLGVAAGFVPLWYDNGLDLRRDRHRRFKRYWKKRFRSIFRARR